MILLKSGRKLTFSVPVGKPHQEMVDMAISLEGLDREDIERVYCIDEPDHSPSTFQSHFDVAGGYIDELSDARDEKIRFLRKHRDVLLKKLDLQFMISLENDCSDCTNHIKDIKKYLRDIPKLFEDYSPSSLKDVIDFNAFDNIFDFTIANPGSGYTTPPLVTISAPDSKFPGFQAEAVAEIKDGKVCNVTATHVGSSYKHAPEVTIAPPNQEGGTTAYAVASEPENNIYTYGEVALEHKNELNEFFYKKPE